MSDLDLPAIAARTDAATPGPWSSTATYPHLVMQPDDDGWMISFNLAGKMVEDAAFVAHAREDVPALLAEVQRLRAELIHFRTEWTVEGDSTWQWLGRILDGEQGCTFHSEANRD